MARAVVDNRAQKPARWAPYMMSLPGLLCLYLFFIVPLVTLLKIALSVRVPGGGTQVEFSWEWANFSQGVHRLRQPAVAGVHLRRRRHDRSAC